MWKERKEVVGGFEMLDMGSASVRDQCKGVVFGELSSEGHAFGEGIKDVAERLLKLLACVGEVKILGKKGEVLIAGVVTSFVVMSPFVGPYLIAKGLYSLS